MGFLAGLHALVSYIGFFATLYWAGAILFGAGDVTRFAKHYRMGSMLAMAFVGLSGVIGLIVTFTNGWAGMLFPWIGLVGVALHGFLGVRAKKALYAMNTGTALKLAVVQVVILIVVTGLMSAKPF